MQTIKLKYYRNNISDFYIKMGIGLILILIIVNIVLLTLFIRETRNSSITRRALQETNKSLALLQDSLAKTDMQKAFTHLDDAKRRIIAALPPPPAAPPAQKGAEPAKEVVETKEKPTPPAKAVAETKEKPAPPAKAVAEPKAPPVPQPVAAPKTPAVPVKIPEFKIPAGETPAPLGSAVAGEYALICEKEVKLLHLFKFQDDRFAFVKSFPAIIGANGMDKKKAGDFATPKGSYFTLRYTPGSALQDIYGEGAFILNYPNYLDRKESKYGSGIWIHGHVPGKVIGTGDLVNTKGCIAISNDHIKELKSLLRPSGTYVSIVDKVAFIKENSRKGEIGEVRNFMDGWRKAWESRDTQKYLGHYAKDFINSEGMTFEAFKRHKDRVNRGKKFIEVKLDQMAIAFPQERGGQVAVVRFIQKYRSNNFDADSKKLFYLKKGPKGWAIFGESAF